MANVKISQLPAVNSVTGTDVLPVVATTTTSQLSIQNLANSLPQVTSSLSASIAVSASHALNADNASTASFVVTAQTASYVENAQTASYVVTALTASYVENAQTASYVVTALTASYVKPLVQDVQITGSLSVSNYALTPELAVYNPAFATFGGFRAVTDFTSTYLYLGNFNQSPQLTIEPSGSTNNFDCLTLTSTTGFSFLPNAGKNVQITGSLNVTGSVIATAGFTGSFTGSFKGDGSQLTGIGTSAFPYTGTAEITGSLEVDGTGSVISLAASNAVNGLFLYAGGLGPSTFPDLYNGPTFPAFPMLVDGTTGLGNGSGGGYTFWYSDKNIGHVVPMPDYNTPAGAIKFVRDQLNTTINSPVGTGRIPYFTVITNNANVIESNLTYTFVAANGRNHALTVTGSILSKDGVSLGTSLSDIHYISGSVRIAGGATGSFTGSFRGSGDFAAGLTVSGSLDVTGSITLNGQSTVKTVKVTVSSASILAMDATPVVLVPAPGAGKAIIPLSLTIGTGAGTGYNNFNITVSNLNANFIDSTSALYPYPFAVASKYYTYTPVNGPQWSAGNEAIEMFATTTPSGGDLSATIYLTYQEITL